MTADIVNLRKARKAKERAAKEKRAAENRVKFGRTKAERTEAEANADLASRRHDALRLARPVSGAKNPAGDGEPAGGSRTTEGRPNANRDGNEEPGP